MMQKKQKKHSKSSNTHKPNFGRVKRKSAFEYAQKVWIHITLRLRKASSGPLLFIDTFYIIK